MCILVQCECMCMRQIGKFFFFYQFITINCHIITNRLLATATSTPFNLSPIAGWLSHLSPLYASKCLFKAAAECKRSRTWSQVQLRTFTTIIIVEIKHDEPRRAFPAARSFTFKLSALHLKHKCIMSTSLKQTLNLLMLQHSGKCWHETILIFLLSTFFSCHQGNFWVESRDATSQLFSSRDPEHRIWVSSVCRWHKVATRTNVIDAPLDIYSVGSDSNHFPLCLFWFGYLLPLFFSNRAGRCQHPDRACPSPTQVPIWTWHNLSSSTRPRWCTLRWSDGNEFKRGPPLSTKPENNF